MEEVFVSIEQPSGDVIAIHKNILAAKEYWSKNYSNVDFIDNCEDNEIVEVVLNNRDDPQSHGLIRRFTFE